MNIYDTVKKEARSVLCWFIWSDLMRHAFRNGGIRAVMAYEKNKENTREVFLKDDRVILDEDFRASFLSQHKNFCYEIRRMKLGDIKVNILGKEYRLEDTARYHYIQGDKEDYINDSDSAKVKRFDKLLTSLDDHGFNPKYMPVLNGYTLCTMDGTHRACYLLYKWGGGTHGRLFTAIHLILN